MNMFRVRAVVVLTAPIQKGVGSLRSNDWLGEDRRDQCTDLECLVDPIGAEQISHRICNF